MKKRDDHLNAGMHGIYFLLQLLMKEGREYLIFEMANKTTYPGWGFMIGQSATTIWESWTGDSQFMTHDFSRIMVYPQCRRHKSE